MIHKQMTSWKVSLKDSLNGFWLAVSKSDSFRIKEIERVSLTELWITWFLYGTKYILNESKFILGFLVIFILWNGCGLGWAPFSTPGRTSVECPLYNQICLQFVNPTFMLSSAFCHPSPAEWNIRCVPRQVRGRPLNVFDVPLRLEHRHLSTPASRPPCYTLDYLYSYSVFLFLFICWKLFISSPLRKNARHFTCFALALFLVNTAG